MKMSAMISAQFSAAGPLQHCSTLATLRRMLQTPGPGPAWPSSPGPSSAPAMDLIVTASGTPVPCSRAALTAAG